MYQKASAKISKWQILTVLLLATSLILLALNYLKIEPIYGWFNLLFTWLTGKIASFNLASMLTGAFDYVTADPMRILTTIGSIVTVSVTAYSLYSKVKADKATATALQQKAEAEIQNSSQLSQVNSAYNQISKEKEDLSAKLKYYEEHDIAGAYSTLKTNYESATSQLQQKQNTINELTNIIENMKVKTQTIVQVK
jgi:hypothetical protein